MDVLTVQSEKPIKSKLFYKIGEVAELAGVEPYVLRYWETEFKFRLNKSNRKQRLYERKDVDYILLIKKLLYVDRFTIEGAQKKLKEIFKAKKNNQLSLVFESGGVSGATLAQAVSPLQRTSSEDKRFLKVYESDLKKLRSLLTDLSAELDR